MNSYVYQLFHVSMRGEMTDLPRRTTKLGTTFKTYRR